MVEKKGGKIKREVESKEDVSAREVEQTFGHLGCSQQWKKQDCGKTEISGRS
jgi:hypothetical protein